jgi:hypothetical protein
VGAGGLNVGALDEADVHAGVGQRIAVGGRPDEIRLHGGAEPIGQAARGDRDDTGLDDIGQSGLLSADLNAAADRQGARDGREAIGGGRRAGAQRQVREIHRQPDVRRRWRHGGNEREVVLEHLVGDRRIADAFPEQVDADAVSPFEQHLDGGKRAAAGPARDADARSG